jgi:hypothetical protein
LKIYDTVKYFDTHDFNILKMSISRLFSTTAKRVVSNAQNSGRFTDTLSNNINKFADGASKFASSTKKFTEPIIKQSRRFYKKYDFETSVAYGAISGCVIGGTVGIYNINKRDDVDKILVKSCGGAIAGTVLGSVFGATWPVSVPLVTLGYAKRAISS